MGPENAYYPRWSPDGRTIAFNTSSEELWLSGRHGSGLRRLSGPEAGDDGSPAWSPDGRRLVFVRAVPPPPGTAGSYRTSLWTIGADGSRPGRFLFSAPRNVVWPEWSPDGRWIAFAVAPPERLWVANADGSQRRRLGPKPLVGQEPRWSPDGTRIAFRSETGAAIRVLDLRSNGIRTVARGTTAAYAWSPDGRRLAVLGATLRECRSGRRCMWLRIVDLASLRTRSAYLLDRAPEIYGLDWRRSP